MLEYEWPSTAKSAEYKRDLAFVKCRTMYRQWGTLTVVYCSLARFRDADDFAKALGSLDSWPRILAFFRDNRITKTWLWAQVQRHANHVSTGIVFPNPEIIADACEGLPPESPISDHPELVRKLRNMHRAFVAYDWSLFDPLVANRPDTLLVRVWRNPDSSVQHMIQAPIYVNEFERSQRFACRVREIGSADFMQYWGRWLLPGALYEALPIFYNSPSREHAKKSASVVVDKPWLTRCAHRDFQGAYVD